MGGGKGGRHGIVSNVDDNLIENETHELTGGMQWYEYNAWHSWCHPCSDPDSNYTRTSTTTFSGPYLPNTPTVQFRLRSLYRWNITWRYCIYILSKYLRKSKKCPSKSSLGNVIDENDYQESIINLYSDSEDNFHPSMKFTVLSVSPIDDSNPYELRHSDEVNKVLSKMIIPTLTSSVGRTVNSIRYQARE